MRRTRGERKAYIHVPTRTYVRYTVRPGTALADTNARPDGFMHGPASALSLHRNNLRGGVLRGVRRRKRGKRVGVLQGDRLDHDRAAKLSRICDIDIAGDDDGLAVMGRMMLA